jgi:acyl-coenzyme A synthetase/AMP-(fatty) acid ligase
MTVLRTGSTRSIQFADDLPKTTTGKILRRALRDGNR